MLRLCRREESFRSKDERAKGATRYGWT